MTPERKAILGRPLSLQERSALQGLEIALLAKRMQQLQQDQADIMTAFAADRLTPSMRSDLSALPPARNRNAKGWESAP